MEMEGGGRLEGGGDASGRRFLLDRSKLRVLLCDKDYKSTQEVLRLLYNCSYQVTTVRTARQVIDMLTTHGTEIDIVLAEVELPIAKGLKMLKCIARKIEWRQIPIIMMSSQDEVSVVVKCLRLGAADYLVKPLRTNELLNLWTHTWRRRRMIGQAEKDIFKQDIELILSDPSDANPNSTTILSEDTDEKNRTTHQEVTLLDWKEHEFENTSMELIQNVSAEETNTLQDTNHPALSGRILSWPRKRNLKVGQTSAFFTYVKSSSPMIKSSFSYVDRDGTPSEHLNGVEHPLVGGNTQNCNSADVQERHSLGNVFQGSKNVSNTSTLQAPIEFPTVCPTSPNKHLLSRNDGQTDVPTMQPIFHVPIYLHGQPSSMQGFHGSLHDTHMQNPPSMLPQFNALHQSHHPPMMRHFAYHPVGINFPSGHAPPAHLWSYSASSHVPQSKSVPTERRAAALRKFKQKKKDRCFDKKIRYVNRKRLAEKRPRVRGQFVRQMNGANVHLNDSSSIKDYDTDEEEYEPASSPDCDISDL